MRITSGHSARLNDQALVKFVHFDDKYNDELILELYDKNDDSDVILVSHR